MSLKSANIEFIKHLNPAFLDALPEECDNPWELVFPEIVDNVNDIQPTNLYNKLSNTYLYPVDQAMDEYTNMRYYNWIQAPQRLTINDYSGIHNTSHENNQFLEITGKNNLSELTLEDVHDLNQDLEPAWTIQQISNYIRQNSIQLAPAPLTSNGCALIIFGLGLGKHLELLIDFLDPSALFIVDPDMGILARSL